MQRMPPRFNFDSSYQLELLDNLVDRTKLYLTNDSGQLKLLDNWEDRTNLYLTANNNCYQKPNSIAQDKLSDSLNQLTSNVPVGSATDTANDSNQLALFDNLVDRIDLYLAGKTIDGNQALDKTDTLQLIPNSTHGDAEKVQTENHQTGSHKRKHTDAINPNMMPIAEPKRKKRISKVIELKYSNYENENNPFAAIHLNEGMTLKELTSIRKALTEGVANKPDLSEIKGMKTAVLKEIKECNGTSVYEYNTIFLYPKSPLPNNINMNNIMLKLGFHDTNKDTASESLTHQFLKISRKSPSSQAGAHKRKQTDSINLNMTPGAKKRKKKGTVKDEFAELKYSNYENENNPFIAVHLNGEVTPQDLKNMRMNLLHGITRNSNLIEFKKYIKTLIHEPNTIFMYPTSPLPKNMKMNAVMLEMGFFDKNKDTASESLIDQFFDISYGYNYALLKYSSYENENNPFVAIHLNEGATLSKLRVIRQGLLEKILYRLDLIDIKGRISTAIHEQSNIIFMYPNSPLPNNMSMNDIMLKLGFHDTNKDTASTVLLHQFSNIPWKRKHPSKSQPEAKKINETVGKGTLASVVPLINKFGLLSSQPSLTMPSVSEAPTSRPPQKFIPFTINE